MVLENLGLILDYKTAAMFADFFAFLACVEALILFLVLMRKRKIHMNVQHQTALLITLKDGYRYLARSPLLLEGSMKDGVAVRFFGKRRGAAGRGTVIAHDDMFTHADRISDIRIIDANTPDDILLPRMGS